MKHVVIKNKALEKLEHNRAEAFMMDALIDNLVDQKLMATGVKRKRKSAQVEEYSLSHKDLIVRQEIMAWSIGGQPIPLLTVSSPSQDKKRKWIVITARVHAGETVGSHKMEGVIRFLTSDTREAIYLRRKYEFKLIPMLNPDGVQVGNFRTNFAGVDLNRRFQKPTAMIHPSVHALRRMLTQKKAKGRTLIYCDLHGHSKKLNSFVYGCNTAANGGFSSWTKV